MSNSRRSEAEYLQRTAGVAWGRHEPFSPPGADTIEESGHLILDFAVLLRCLKPTASGLILDLGSGGGWCSDWLGRLNCRSIAVDISHDMLRVGRSRTDPRRGCSPKRRSSRASCALSAEATVSCLREPKKRS